MDGTKVALAILGAGLVWLAYKTGERIAYKNARIVVGLVDEGLATVNEDGTVVMVEEQPFGDQAEVAAWQ